MTRPELADLKSAGISAALLDLNNHHAEALSYLDLERFGRLVSEAFLACCVGEAEALLLAFDQDASYDSPNFLWFRQRHERFVYIDRIVVDPRQRGRGLARALYEKLFARARDAGHDRVVCEVNSQPPNLESDAFHARLGFVVVGEASFAEGHKRVRYFSRALPGDTTERRQPAPPA